METFDQIIEQHIYLLNAKGYHEKALNSLERQGTLATQLEKAFEKAVADACGPGDLQSFYLIITGFFNNLNDQVHFKLHYQYHPKYEQLYLKTLVVRMFQMQKILFLQRSRNLPAALKVYELLDQERTNKLSGPVIRYATLFQ